MSDFELFLWFFFMPCLLTLAIGLVSGFIKGEFDNTPIDGAEEFWEYCKDEN